LLDAHGMRAIFCLTLALAAAAPSRTAWCASGAEVLARARGVTALARDKSVRVTMTIVDPGGSSLVRTIDGVEKATTEGRKLRWTFDSPTELAGTTLLAWQERAGRDRLWVYFPAQRRPRQVTDQMRRERFQGSDITYEDLSVILYSEYDGEHTLVREESCAGGTCDVVETVLPADRFAYERLVTWLRRDLGVPYRIEFFAGDTKLKVVTVPDVAVLEGIPSVVALTAEGSDGSRTNVRFDDIHYNTGLDDRLFDLAALSRGK
jgi:hypothetical protein